MEMPRGLIEINRDFQVETGKLNKGACNVFAIKTTRKLIMIFVYDFHLRQIRFSVSIMAQILELCIGIL